MTELLVWNHGDLYFDCRGYVMPLPPDLPTDDADLNDAREFTVIEVATLTAWLAAYLDGARDTANDIAETGLLAEHYRSRITLLSTPGGAGNPLTEPRQKVLSALVEAARKTRETSGYGI